jgi:DNA-binding transcriptional regulator YiaG
MPTSIATAIVTARTAAGLSRLALAHALSQTLPTSLYTVNAWEKGERVPDPKHLRALGTVLGWSERKYSSLVLEAEKLRVNGGA